MKLILAIGLGGALGAVSRHYFAAAVMRLFGGQFPFGIMITNILGSFLMGVLISVLAGKFSLSSEWRHFITVGFLGAFTTFSTFSMEAVMLLERGALWTAALYIVGSVVLAIIGLILGMQIGKIL
ncbi:fluoride efflux transporter CrcB [Temperatibacter marinus]|uniref:Fluoride-specific ion channel FluC n=1 Tax=Temperatibacter marinus TaxID=1456591 RepID=A0AA52EFW2_9PROT|nr:fluoride efflux transporter CrcB [Temperatibacter marinus]WND01574.1 fluoride efflux transporter CrcB [Temperatibacter marinus]